MLDLTRILRCRILKSSLKRWGIKKCYGIERGNILPRIRWLFGTLIILIQIYSSPVNFQFYTSCTSKSHEVLTAETNSCSLKSTYWPSSYIFLPSYSYKRANYITKFSQRTRAKGKIHATLVVFIESFAYELLHAISLQPGGRSRQSVNLFSMEEPAIRWKVSLLSDCMKGSFLTGLTLSNFVSRN